MNNNKFQLEVTKTKHPIQFDPHNYYLLSSSITVREYTKFGFWKNSSINSYMSLCSVVPFMVPIKFHWSILINSNWNWNIPNVVPTKLTNEIQLQCHTHEFYWLISIEDLHWNIPIALQCSNCTTLSLCDTN